MDDAALRVVFEDRMRGFVFRNGLFQTLFIASRQRGELLMKLVNGVAVRVGYGGDFGSYV
jgi:hypothetical protein